MSSSRLSPKRVLGLLSISKGRLRLIFVQKYDFFQRSRRGKCKTSRRFVQKGMSFFDKTDVPFKRNRCPFWRGTMGGVEEYAGIFGEIWRHVGGRGAGGRLKDDIIFERK